MANILRINLRTLEKTDSLKPDEVEIINRNIWEIEQKLNEMIEKLNTL